MTIRPATQADKFYPGNPRQLAALVDGMLEKAAARIREPAPEPKALIAPHAGYIYSGPVAASAYALLAQSRGRIRRAALFGPSHWTDFEGVAGPEAEAFATPLGVLPVEVETMRELAEAGAIELWDSPHWPEHSLEVHLPFLQRALGDCAILPFLVGRAGPEEVGRVMEAVYGGPETCLIVSSDLSHYLDYETARAKDRRTAEAILALDYEHIDGEAACGYAPVRGLLWLARRRGLRPRLLDLRNSGDTAGPADRVVGYGAFAFEEPEPSG